MADIPLPGLARKLVADGLLNQQAAEDAVQAAQKEKEPFISYIVQKGLVGSYDIAKVNSELFGIPLFDINSLDFEHVPTTAISEKLIRQHRTFPLFKRGNRLFVGVSDPTIGKDVDEIRFNSGLNVETILVEEAKLTAAIEKLLDSSADDLGDLDDEELEGLNVESVEEDMEEDKAGGDREDAPVVKFVNKMLLSAIKAGRIGFAL